MVQASLGNEKSHLAFNVITGMDLKLMFSHDWSGILSD